MVVKLRAQALGGAAAGAGLGGSTNIQMRTLKAKVEKGSM